eukprot:TRINITY_DN5013_c0_g1_i1.p1 TRINITY_DN5013_c0_g1~~TRINITY_DN5013_c0_g1_i1.p1  ORF type:complete len:386 (-),score=63.32 TRINITY_DN5013_c0_g1_i1:109-1200(-)
MESFNLTQYRNQIISSIYEREVIVYCTVFSLDGNYMIAGTNFGSLCVYNLSTSLSQLPYTRTPIFSFQAHEGPIYCLSFTNDRILLSGADEEIRGWNWKEIEESIQRGKGSVKHVFELIPKHIESSRSSVSLVTETNGMAFDSFHNALWSVGGDKYGYLWDVETRQCTGVLKGHTDYLHCVTLGKTSFQPITGSEDGTVKIWDPKTLQSTGTLEPYKIALPPTHSVPPMDISSGKWVGAVGLNDDETWLVCGGGFKGLHVFHLPTLSLSRTLPSVGNTQSLCFDEQDGRLISVGNSKYVYHWNLDGRLERKVSTTSGPTSLWTASINNYSQKNRILVAGGASQNINVFINWGHSATTFQIKNE